MRCLLPPPSLNSHRYIPCQVPRFSLPFVIGIVSETPTILDLAWADISVGPSSWWRYLGSPSGTNLSKIPFRSYRTSGSKFSLSDNPQLVCLTKRFSIPVFGNAGKWWSTSLVTRWKPRGKGRNENSTCCIIFFCLYSYNSFFSHSPKNLSYNS